MIAQQKATKIQCESNNDYHQLDGVSKSRIAHFRNHPMLYYRYYVARDLSPPGPTADMEIGQAFDELITEGCLTTCVEIPRDVLNADGHKKGKAWTTFSAENSGKILLKGEQVKTILAMRDALMSHGTARQLILGASHFQLPLSMIDPDTGLLIRGKLDALTSNIVVDVKTAASAEPYKFSCDAETYGYDIQDAMYRRLASSYLGKDVKFYFIVVEKEYPFRVETYKLDDDFVASGNEKLDQSLSEIATCYQTGEWAFPHHGQLVTLPKPNRKNWKVSPCR